MKTDRKLIHLLDNSSVSLAQLATLLQAQSDELQSCDDTTGGDSDNWQYSKNQIEVIGNIVMNRLKRYSNRFDRIAKDYYINHDKH